jgi:probable HAF family extracellular repeat protein
VSFAVLLMIVAVSSLSASQQYTVTDLGTLGGTISTSLGINAGGQVVGFSTLTDGTDRAFLWSSQSGMINLGALQASDLSVGYSVNLYGEVVGKSYSVSGSNAFLWTKSVGMQNLGSLGGASSTAYGINDSGQVVGQSTLSDGVSVHAFLWTSRAGMQDLGTLGGNFSYAYGINDAGQVVGLSYLSGNASWHAFLWTQAAGMQDLGTLGGTNSRAFAVNSLGQVLGTSDLVSGSQATFLWNAGQGMQIVTALNKYASASGFNRRDQIVGGWGAGSHNSGFIWSKALGTQPLNSLIPPGQELTLSAAAISDGGVIAAIGVNNHALLLTPTKQPSSQRSKP